MQNHYNCYIDFGGKNAFGPADIDYGCWIINLACYLCNIGCERYYHRSSCDQAFVLVVNRWQGMYTLHIWTEKYRLPSFFHEVSSWLRGDFTLLKLFSAICCRTKELCASEQPAGLSVLPPYHTPVGNRASVQMCHWSAWVKKCMYCVSSCLLLTRSARLY